MRDLNKLTLKQLIKINKAYAQIEELDTIFKGPYPIYSIYRRKRDSLHCDCIFQSDWLYDLNDDPHVNSAERYGPYRK